ncbi:hypothetical protein BRW83_2131 [Oxalobacter formigenes]|nr:hypothetical protein BRW83_2131 [Oxalobacter formigenes]
MCIGRDLDQIDVRFFRQLESFLKADNTNRLIVNADKAYFLSRNLPVQAM